MSVMCQVLPGCIAGAMCQQRECVRGSLHLCTVSIDLARSVLQKGCTTIGVYHNWVVFVSVEGVAVC